jgi:hypothetical protein
MCVRRPIRTGTDQCYEGCLSCDLKSLARMAQHDRWPDDNTRRESVERHPYLYLFQMPRRSAEQCVDNPSEDCAVSFSTTAQIRSRLGPFGPGFVRHFGENNSRYFRRTKARWKANSVDGFTVIAVRTSRRGTISNAHKPATNRSDTRRFGARRRERFRISN